CQIALENRPVGQEMGLSVALIVEEIVVTSSKNLHSECTTLARPTRKREQRALWESYMVLKTRARARAECEHERSFTLKTTGPICLSRPGEKVSKIREILD